MAKKMVQVNQEEAPLIDGEVINETPVQCLCQKLIRVIIPPTETEPRTFITPYYVCTKCAGIKFFPNVVEYSPEQFREMANAAIKLVKRVSNE